jgi:glycosyltransferase involved in cell wall biosynthesis
MREAKKHFPVTVLLPEKSDTQVVGFLDKVGVPYEFMPFHRNIKPARGAVEKIKRRLDKLTHESALLNFLKRYDLKNSVVHIELAPWHSIGQLEKLCGRAGQVFITMHNQLTPDSPARLETWKKRLARIAKKKNFHILASNRDAKESLRAMAPASLVDDIAVTYTSVNPPEIDEILRVDFDRAALCRKFGLNENRFTVVAIGQFIDRKGRWTFLDAAQKLARDGEDIQFVWVSNSKPPDDDWKQIEEYGLGDNFQLIMNDRVGNERRDILQMYRLGHVFALPSYVEGLPIALLEAMALRVPSISTNVNGIPEAIRHLDTGWLIPPGDSDALANAISVLKNDEALRTKLADNGREIVLREFDEREAAKLAVASYIKAFER